MPYSLLCCCMDPESKCNDCGMVFVNTDELAGHRNAVHAGTMLQCQSCNKFFESKQEFEEHAFEVHGEKSQAASSPAGTLKSDEKIDEAESMLLGRSMDEEKARQRTRGPYRKSALS